MQIGSWYYFNHARNMPATKSIPAGKPPHPGRENAEETFVQRADFISAGEQLVETDIVGMGNRAAIELLQNQIDEARRTISNMGAAADNGLRRQLEKEIQALSEKKAQLGDRQFVGQSVKRSSSPVAA